MKELWAFMIEYEGFTFQGAKFPFYQRLIYSHIDNGRAVYLDNFDNKWYVEWADDIGYWLADNRR